MHVPVSANYNQRVTSWRWEVECPVGSRGDDAKGNVADRHERKKKIHSNRTYSLRKQRRNTNTFSLTQLTQNKSPRIFTDSLNPKNSMPHSRFWKVTVFWKFSFCNISSTCFSWIHTPAIIEHLLLYLWTIICPPDWLSTLSLPLWSILHIPTDLFYFHLVIFLPKIH